MGRAVTPSTSKGVKKTPVKKMKKETPAAKEVVVEKKAGNVKAKKSVGGSKKGKGKEREKSGVLRQSMQTKSVKRVETLLSKDVSVGMILLGTVRELSELEMKVTLPNNLTGHCDIAEVSDILTEMLENEVNDDDSDADMSDSDDDEDQVKKSTDMSLGDLFFVGQVVKCVVLEVVNEEKRSKKVMVSLRPSLVNAGLSMRSLTDGMHVYASVKSVEDHGYVMDLGLTDDIHAFLPRTKTDIHHAAETEGVEKPHFRVGQPLDCVVTSSGDRSVKLSAIFSTVSKAKVKHGDVFELDSLKAGMLVSGRVMKTLSTGLAVEFWGFFTGTVHNTQLEKRFDYSKDFKKKKKTAEDEEDVEQTTHLYGYTVGDQITTRILYVDYVNKLVALTELPHLVAYSPYAFPPDAYVGFIYEKAEVMTVLPRGGIYLKVNQRTAKYQDDSDDEDEDNNDDDDDEEEEDEDETPSQFAFVHISNVKDGHVTSLTSIHKVGDTVRCRVIGHDLLDGILVATMKESVLAQPFLKYGDVVVGEKVEGTILSVGDHGAVVKLTDTLKGFVPAVHLADVKISKPALKFRTGQRFKCRVLAVNPEERRLILTHKKTLVNSKLPHIISYADTAVGMRLHGFVSRIEAFGLIVSFFNNVSGLIPIKQISTAFVKPSALKRMYSVGQVVKARVIHTDAPARRLILSLILNQEVTSAAASGENNLKSSGWAAIRSGEVYNQCVVKGIKAGGMVLALTKGAAATAKNGANKKKKKKTSKDDDEEEEEEEEEDGASVDEGVVGHLSATQLSDHLSHSKDLLTTFQVGDVIDNVLVLEKDAEKGRVRLSVKPALVAAARRGDVPQSYDDAAAREINSMMTGVVRKVTDFGCFVAFLNGYSALVHKSEMAESFVSDPNDFVKVGQTVVPSLLGVDTDRKVIKLSLKNRKQLQAVPTAASAAAADKTPSKKRKRKGSRAEEEAGADADATATAALPVDVAYLSSFFAEASRLSAVSVKSGSETEKKKMSDVLSFALGSACDAEVQTVQNYGVVLQLQQQSSAKKAPVVATAFAITEQAKGVANLEKGSDVRARVLDVNTRKAIADVSLRPAFVKAAAAAAEPSSAKRRKSKGTSAAAPASSSSSSSPSVGEFVNAVIELVKENYLVLSTHSGANVGYAPTRNPNNSSWFSSHSHFKCGQKIKAAARVSVEDAVSGNVRWVYSLEALAAKDKKTLPPTENTGLLTYSDAKVGMVVTCAIKQIGDSHMNVSLGAHVNGRVHVTEVVDAACAEHPFLKYSVGEKVEGKIVSVTEKASNRFLPISHQNPVAMTIIDVTVRPSQLNQSVNGKKKATASIKPVKLSQLNKGQKLLGFVQDVQESGMWIHVSPTVRGRIHLMDISDDIDILSEVAKHFQPGNGVQCWVSAVDVDKSQLDLTLIDPKKRKFTPGAMACGRITAIKPSSGVNVSLGAHLQGNVFPTDVDDDFKAKGISGLKEKQFVRCCILSKTAHGYNLSLRPSKTGTSAPVTKTYPEIQKIEDVTAGALVQGIVKHSSDKQGCFVHLSRDVMARVVVSELSDRYIKKVTSAFPVGKAVSGRILSVDHSSNRVELSLKKSVVAPGKRLIFDDVKPGSKYRGKVTSVREYGVFVRLDHSTISGLCHKSEVADDEVASLESLYSTGDIVKVIVLKKDAEKNQLSLGLKGSYFDDDDESDDGDVDSDDDEEEEEEENDGKDDEKKTTASGQKRKRKGGNDGDDEDEEADDSRGKRKKKVDGMDLVKSDIRRKLDHHQSHKNNDSDDDDEVEMDDGESEEEEEASEESEQESEEEEEDEPMGLSGVGFLWSGTAHDPAKKDEGDESDDNDDDDEEEEDDMEEDEDETDNANKKKTKRQKAAEKKRHAESIREAEEAMLEDKPESAADFERKVIANPDSSYVWMQFVAFYLSMAEFDKARSVADRALKRIHVRKEKERANVFVGLMNLENMHGSHESLMKVFDRAIRECEPRSVFFHLANIHRRSERVDMAEQVYTTMQRKFGSSAKVWVANANYRLQRGDKEGFRAVLQKALKVLPRRKHIRTISKFGQMEFKTGSVERGRTIFDGIVSNYPKRVDIWNIYVDMELRNADEDTIRHLFQRIASLQLSSKKMKYFFKRWLLFEKENGDANSIEVVKQRVREYLSAKA